MSRWAIHSGLKRSRRLPLSGGPFDAHACRPVAENDAVSDPLTRQMNRQMPDEDPATSSAVTATITTSLNQQRHMSQTARPPAFDPSR